MGDILDERNLVNNSTKFEYYEVKTDLGTDLNDTRTYYIVSESLGRWEIPCLSYLDVVGQLVESDGTSIYCRCTRKISRCNYNK